VNHGTVAASGWGIPTATDIAFAVGILSILGDKVPVSLKVFLTALAIADDLIAILVVAFFYGGNIKLPLLGIAVLVILFVALMKRLGEKRVGFYFVPAIIVWFLFYYSGIHATMTGVVIAMLIPMEARYNKAKFHRRARILYNSLTESERHSSPEDFPNGPQRHYLRRLSGLTKRTIPPSYRLEHKLNPIVNFAIMPIFALANAGVEITDPSYFNVFSGGVGMGIFLGLVLGKPVGITLASWLAMSIFVDTLSFAGEGIDPALTQHLRDAGKMAVLMGSVFAGMLGSLFITIVHKLEKKK
jgi:NhaA family Na+:H+ antiporter